ncbi:MAG TPA: DciA family protein, partial [Candidatus Binatia bacterium]|nr:DciA family protein [Candidatus Binatia bacterium]
MTPRPPRAVSELLLHAVPELRDRLIEDGVRRAWPALVGPDLARRSRPLRLHGTTLEVGVDNSPWLSELTLRAADLVGRVRSRFAAVTALRFVLAPADPAAARAEPRSRPRRRPLQADEFREIDASVAAIADDSLRAAARRLLVTARSTVVALSAAVLALGCAGHRTVTATAVEGPRPAARPTAPSQTAEAYYHYSVAQLHAQAGRFREAVAAIEEAIKRDPDSAFLWRELAQW